MSMWRPYRFLCAVLLVVAAGLFQLAAVGHAAAADAVVTGITPNSGAKDKIVTITGSGFNAICDFPSLCGPKFGADYGTIISYTDTTIVASVPAGRGVVDVTVCVVVTDACTATSSADRFTYIAPAVTGLSVHSGTEGTIVTITGVEFNSICAGSSICGPKFGRNYGTVLSFTDTTITASVPAGTGVVHVTVCAVVPDTCSATSAVDHFTYTGSVTPNPAADPEVAAIMASQAASMRQAAALQTAVVNQHMESLHREDAGCGAEVCVVNGVGFRGAQSAGGRDSAGYYTDPTADRDRGTTTRVAGIGAIAGADRSPADGTRSLGRGIGKTPGILPVFTLWTAGTVIAGKTEAAAERSGSTMALSALTLGIDRRVTGDLKVGVALTIAGSRSDIGTAGSRTTFAGQGATAYASYRAAPAIFIDAALGTGGAALTSHRYSSDAGSFLDGRRRGTMTFGSLSLTSERTWNRLRYAPYARFQFVAARLNSFEETGDSIFTLNYATSRFASTAGVLGLRMAYDVEMGGAVLSPTVRMEMQRTFAGAISQGIAYVDDPATSYSLATAAAASTQIGGALGMMSRASNGLTGGVEYLISHDAAGLHGRGVRGNLGILF